MSRPFISVLTPTQNRGKFWPALVQCQKAQTYPKERMEWIILDDGSESVEEIVKKHTAGIPNVRQIREESKLNIGAKRNKLNELAKGTICVCMDDDDFYCPERVAHAVTRLESQPKVELAGSSELQMQYSDDGSIWKFGPQNQNHATNGTMAYRTSQGKTRKQDETVTFAEEKSFLENYKNPMVQLDPRKVMLVMAHRENTFDKKDLRKAESPFVKSTPLKIRDFIKDKALRDFYATA